MKSSAWLLVACTVFACMVAAGLSACASGKQAETQHSSEQLAMRADDLGVSSSSTASAGDAAAASAASQAGAASQAASSTGQAGAASESTAAENAEPASGGSPNLVDEARAALNMSEDYRASFDHGPKEAQNQRYIMLHDTEGEGSASGIVNYWDSSGSGVAAHFVVNKDGSIVQCVPLDRIAHHAGYGDAGHNDLYGIVEDGRDDMVGTVPIGDWAPDYGMNAWSVGIEMVHVGGTGYYPEEQLAAVDALIAYIDAYFGSQSAIIDHKAWRSGNSDTSPEFAEYLANYQAHRTHN